MNRGIEELYPRSYFQAIFRHLNFCFLTTPAISSLGDRPRFDARIDSFVPVEREFALAIGTVCDEREGCLGAGVVFDEPLRNSLDSERLDEELTEWISTDAGPKLGRLVEPGEPHGDVCRCATRTSTELFDADEWADAPGNEIDECLSCDDYPRAHMDAMYRSDKRSAIRKGVLWVE